MQVSTGLSNRCASVRVDAGQRDSDRSLITLRVGTTISDHPRDCLLIAITIRATAYPYYQGYYHPLWHSY